MGHSGVIVPDTYAYLSESNEKELRCSSPLTFFVLVSSGTHRGKQIPPERRGRSTLALFDRHILN